MRTAKNDLIQVLLDLNRAGIDRLYVYRFPDYAGGYQHDITAAPVVADFTYLEFEGDISKVYAKRNTIFVDHYEHRYEPPTDVEITLGDLVFAKFFPF